MRLLPSFLTFPSAMAVSARSPSIAVSLPVMPAVTLKVPGTPSETADIMMHGVAVWIYPPKTHETVHVVLERVRVIGGSESERPIPKSRHLLEVLLVRVTYQYE